MKKIFILIFTYCAVVVHAQTPDEALRTAWFTQNGTARVLAVGGVMGSLGGDITSNHINPAGLGLYKTNELILSPGFLFNNNKFNYRGKDSSASKSNFGYGTSGIVLAGNNAGRSKWTSTAFAISVNQMANYNNNIQYGGFNNFSSFSEKYLEELVKDRADTNAALSNYIFGSSLAFRTYLIDTIRGPGGAFTGYQSLVPISTGVHQMYNAQTRGGYNEVAIGLAGNMNDQLYVGGSFTIPIISYSRDLIYSEKDASNNTNNQFSFFEYKESYSSKGAGIGAKIGLIYKPKEFIRLGLAIHTPQFLTMTDRIRSSMTTNTESYAGLLTETSDKLNSGNEGISKYTLTTPYRVIASASYVFREVNDTRLQKGFISADIEFVNYRGARFGTGDENAQDINLQNYFRQLNETTKETYKGNINAKLGGELKFNTWMFRLGGAYYGSPYADNVLKASRVIATGGLGYRNKGFFVDLAYTHIMNKDFRFPYLLEDKANTFAKQTGFRGNVMVTFGVKF